MDEVKMCYVIKSFLKCDYFLASYRTEIFYIIRLTEVAQNRYLHKAIIYYLLLHLSKQ